MEVFMKASNETTTLSTILIPAGDFTEAFKESACAVKSSRSKSGMIEMSLETTTASICWSYSLVMSASLCERLMLSILEAMSSDT